MYQDIYKGHKKVCVLKCTKCLRPRVFRCTNVYQNVRYTNMRAVQQIHKHTDTNMRAVQQRHKHTDGLDKLSIVTTRNTQREEEAVRTLSAILLHAHPPAPEGLNRQRRLLS